MNAFDQKHSREHPSRMTKALGFFFAFRIALSYLFFQDDPQQGFILSGLLSLAFTLLFFVRWAAGLEKWQGSRPTATMKWVLAYLLWALISIAWTPTPTGTALGHWGLIALDVLLVLLATNLAPEETVAQNVMRGWILGDLSLSILIPFLPTEESGRIYNEGVLNPHNLGPTLALGTIFSLFLWMETKRRVWAACTIILFVAVFASGDKTDMMTTLVAGAVLLLFWRSINLKIRLKLFLVSCVVMLAVLLAFGGYLSNYFFDSDAIFSLTGRTLVWSEAISYATQHPLMGNGFYASRDILLLNSGFDPGHAHNEVLQVWLTLGLVGVVILSIVYVSFWRSARDRGTLKTLVSAVSVYALLHGLAEAPFDLSLPISIMLTLAAWVQRFDGEAVNECEI